MATRRTKGESYWPMRITGQLLFRTTGIYITKLAKTEVIIPSNEVAAIRNAAALFDDRDMPCGGARYRTGQPRVVSHLDLPSERAKAGALIERKCFGVIERAGVKPDPVDRV